MEVNYYEGMPLSEKIDDNILGSSRSTEVRKLGDRFVIKELGKTYTLQKEIQESDQEYSSRRVKMCLDILKNEKKLAEEASEYIPDRVETHLESYFIAKGKDGFPTSFKIQEIVRGETLREQPDLVVGQNLQRDLDNLVTASVKCFFKTGKVFDLVGCVGGDGEGVWEEIKRHLDPIHYAANLMVTESGRLAFIDARVGGGNIFKQVVSLMTLAGYYWRKVGEKKLTK